MLPEPFAPGPTPPPLTRLTETDKHWREYVRTFAEHEIRPRSSDMDRSATLDLDLRRSLFDAGLMGIAIPPEYGGLGGGLFHVVLAIEEVARVDAGVAVAVDVHNALVVATVLRSADGDQRRRHLPLLSRTKIGAFAISEEQAGSDAFALSTTARAVPGGYLLTGRKRWTSNAAHADLFLVFADDADGGGIGGYLVERDASGLSVVPRTEQLGVRAASTADLVLEEVHVRAGHCLGGVGGGRALAAEALDVGRLGIAAQLVGLAQGALDQAIDYARKREQFGRRIADYQGVQFTLARIRTDVEAARVLLYNATRVFEAGADRLEQARQAAMAKLLASETAERAASHALELLGGNGYTREYPIERFFRDAKAGKIYEGTTNMLLKTIGATLIGAES